MRIVSLVPAATEIAAAIGALDDLVAVTHDCDHPAAVRGLPRVTRSTIAAGTDSASIDAAVRAAGDRGESTFHLDADALHAAAPDVLLGQTLCRVCAVTLEQVPSTLRHAPDVVPLEAATIEGIFEDIARIAAALGRADAGASLVADLRSRVRAIERAVAGRPRARVACLEWISPLFNAGHWVPEQIRCAGAEDVLGMAGARSREVDWAELVAASPDWVFVMLCGFDATRAAREAASLAGRAEWDALPAVEAGRVFALDGNAYFSRPGPRVVDGAQLLASIVHPDRVQPPGGAAAIRVDPRYS
jgi:iron complex transport system substrate-binding protein